MDPLERIDEIIAMVEGARADSTMEMISSMRSSGSTGTSPLLPPLMCSPP